MLKTKGLPTSLLLIQTIFSKLDQLYDQHGTELSSGAYKTSLSKIVSDPDTFKSSALNVSLVQLFCLLGFSFHKSIFIPDLKSFSDDGNTVSLYWEGGIKDQFKWGVWDEGFTKFYKHTNKAILSLKLTEISPLFFQKMALCISNYIVNINTLREIVEKLIQNPLAEVESDFSASVLFLLLACFRAEHLNSLFIHISQYLPEELEIKSGHHNVRVVPLFQSNSQDPLFLIQKLHLYLDLYRDDLPIIKSITEKTTVDYMIKTLKNDHFRQYIIENLKGIYTQQIIFRLKLYYVGTKFLEYIL